MSGQDLPYGPVPSDRQGGSAPFGAPVDYSAQSSTTAGPVAGSPATATGGYGAGPGYGPAPGYGVAPDQPGSVDHGGQTPGMKFLGLKIVREEDGGEPTLGQHTLRWLLLIVDGLAAGLEGLLIMVTSRRRQRLGDMAAHTLVVRA